MAVAVTIGGGRGARVNVAGESSLYGRAWPGTARPQSVGESLDGRAIVVPVRTERSSGGAGPSVGRARRMAVGWAEMAATRVVAFQATPLSRVVPTLPKRADSDVSRMGSGAEQWRDLVCAAPFTWDCTWAMRTISCESGFNPDAVNPAGPYHGLWQVANGPFDPYLNSVEAHIQFVEWRRGIRAVSPWPSCGATYP